jgi:hypothetical protein
MANLNEFQAVGGWDLQEAEERYRLIENGRARFEGPDGELMDQPDSFRDYMNKLEQANQNRQCLYLAENGILSSLSTPESVAMIGKYLPQTDVMLGGRLWVRLT